MIIYSPQTGTLINPPTPLSLPRSVNVDVCKLISTLMNVRVDREVSWSDQTPDIYQVLKHANDEPLVAGLTVCKPSKTAEKSTKRGEGRREGWYIMG